ncbi:IclR family transcriptional regulator [Actinokineospora sp. PR83]|uniref:IclR family transcriptional regulator n=1 Tax=Actinokineospora sp. PR83 TaxID=2884908 RepID=UPI0027E0B210|nr:IclR family transcriptional regulator [Actinokineospora sp. PR83]MCG8917213.1 IclR family transcriptional regulator [Actinokineospora sp. PR83]
MSGDKGPVTSDRSAGEPVLDRAFRLLGAFSVADDSLSLTSLSTRSGLPKSTALRMATRLVGLGALERTGDGRYVIGLRLYELASLAPSHGLRGVALPYLEDLHHATGQHVLLAVRDGHEAVLVERLSAHRAGRVLYRVGGRMPLHATGVGLALLAHAPDAVQREVLDGDLTLRPENLARSPREVRRLLAGVRTEGVAVISRARPEPMTSVAAPVFGPGRAVVAALSVVVPAGSADASAVRPAVIAVSRAVSRQVGHREGGAGRGRGLAAGG